MKKIILTFDHNHGMLEAMGKACGATIISGDNDSQAAKDISAIVGAKLVLGHFDRDGWSVLKQKCNEHDVLVRFSTTLSDEPSPAPSSESPLFLHCRKRIAELVEDDLKTLAIGLASDEMIARLRSGETPLELRSYFSFRQPNYTIALAILVTGALHAPVGKREKTLAAEWWEAVLGKNVAALKEQLRKEHGFVDEGALAKAFPATAAFLKAGFKLPTDEKARVLLLEQIIAECSTAA